MRVSWTTSTIGTIHADMPEDEVMAFCKSIIALGFTPEVTQE